MLGYKKENVVNGAEMKHALLLIFLLVCGITPYTHTAHMNDFDVILLPHWNNLEHTTERIQQFGGKWILAGSITFKKKAKDTVHLNQLSLRWKGPKLQQLLGSLYKKELDKEFIPIEDNLICDGSWNKAKQTLQLKFNEKQTLGPINIFYLVLTVPEPVEPLVKQGQFDVISTSLPEQYKICTRNHTLSISYSSLSQQKPIATAIDVEH